MTLDTFSADRKKQVKFQFVLNYLNCKRNLPQPRLNSNQIRLFGQKMRINFAHMRDRSTTGGWINFAVFEANSNNGTDNGRAKVLHDLTIRARASGLRVDKSALAFNQNGEIMFYGSPDLVDYLSNMGVPRWTHSLDF